MQISRHPTEKPDNRIPLLLAALLLGFFIAAYYPIFEILAKKWAGSDDYTHAFFTVPIILYMGWLKKDSFLKGSAGSILGLICTVAATCFYLLSLQLQIPSFIAVAMVMMVVGSLWYLAGFSFVREMTIPILLLLLLIPIPDQLLSMLTISLQFKVSQASELLIRLCNVPLFREGNVLTIPEKTFQVVEACSGIRSLISLITLSLILGYFTLEKFLSRSILLLFSIPVAIIINILRVVSLVLAYHFFRFDLSAGLAHTLMGLALFAIALAILFLIQRMLETWETPKKHS